MKRFLSTWSCALLLLLALPLAAMAVTNMSPAEVSDALQQNGTEWVIIDARTPAEYDEGHLKDAANADFMAENFEEIIGPLDMDDTYLVYCRTGERSAKAAEKMEKMGFKNVVNMKGGIEGWKKAQLPLAKD